MNVRVTPPRFRTLFWASGALRGDRENAIPIDEIEKTAEKSEERTAPSPRLLEAPDEAQWLLRARQGDVAAFEWLMDRYRERAVRLAAHTLRRPSEAEDLVQEAFVRAFVQIRNFRGEATFYSWIYTIVVRLCLNRIRQPQWYREWELVLDDEPSDASASRAEQYENRMLIDTLLDRLSPPLRAALVLRELEGMEYAEIADALDIPVGTVRSRLNAARQQFRALWERAMEEAANV